MSSSLAPCIACNEQAGRLILRMPSLPVDSNRLWDSHEGARSAQKAEIDLAQCSSCGHLYNGTHQDELVNYEESYENSQHFSPRFQAYAENLVDRLIGKYGLQGKHLLEIGGGRGEFLRIMCERGTNTGIIFEPSYSPAPNDNIPPYISFVTDYYTERYADHQADFILCRHVLEHLSNAGELIRTVRRAIGNRDIVLYFEVPNAEEMLKSGMVWDIIYPHCSYFTSNSLERLFRDSGFAIRSVDTTFNGQFISIEATPNGSLAANEVQEKPISSPLRYKAWELEELLARSIAQWRQRLASFRADGRRVALWGAGAKGVTFLNLLDPNAEFVSHVVDVNPRKIGRFIPGSGHKIVMPEHLGELRPDDIVVMNPAYLDEIRSITAANGVRADFTASC